MPQDLKDANITPIFRKSNWKECENYHRICLLSIAGKNHGSMLLNRVNAVISPKVLLETQCCFRENRSTMNVLFNLCQVQDKCQEQIMLL